MTDSLQPQSKRKLLVVTRTTFFDIDKIVAAIVLGKLLSKQPNTDVDLYFGEQLPLNTLTTIVSPQDVNFREKLVPDYFTLSINRGNAKVKEVKWEEVGSELKLIIYTDQGEIAAADHKVGGATPAYAGVYALGIKTKDEVQNALGEFANLWNTTQTYNLDIRTENQRYAANNFIYADAKSFAESVYKFAQESEIEVSAAEATELLSCIYWKTNSLRNKYATADALATVQQLIQTGGSLTDAVSHVFSTLSFVEVRARQDIYKSLKLTAEKIAFAQVTPETARQLSKIEPINPEKNPLFKLKDAIASFVLVPLTSDKTLVLCSSRDEKINIKRLYSNYNYVGDNLQAELLFNMNVADTEKELKRGLLKVFPQAAARTDKSQSTSSAAVTSTPTTPIPAVAPHQPAPVPTEPARVTEVGHTSVAAPEMIPKTINTVEPDMAPSPVKPIEIPEPDVEIPPLPAESITSQEAAQIANEALDIPAEIFAEPTLENEVSEPVESYMGDADPLAPASESELATIVSSTPQQSPTSDDPLPTAN